MREEMLAYVAGLITGGVFGSLAFGPAIAHRRLLRAIRKYEKQRPQEPLTGSELYDRLREFDR